jgi:hypothetical protein
VNGPARTRPNPRTWPSSRLSQAWASSSETCRPCSRSRRRSRLSHLPPVSARLRADDPPTPHRCTMRRGSQAGRGEAKNGRRHMLQGAAAPARRGGGDARRLAPQVPSTALAAPRRAPGQLRPRSRGRASTGAFSLQTELSFDSLPSVRREGPTKAPSVKAPRVRLEFVCPLERKKDSFRLEFYSDPRPRAQKPPDARSRHTRVRNLRDIGRTRACCSLP